jgi:hypothetical protein
VPADWDTLTVPLATGAWTHVVATYDGVTMRLWTNGRLAGELGSTLRDRQGGYLTIGATVRGWLEWDGRIDEAALYRGPLTARQVADHHRAGTALAVPRPDRAGRTRSETRRALTEGWPARVARRSARRGGQGDGAGVDLGRARDRDAVPACRA